MTAFADRLRQTRLSRNLNQSELAERAGVSQPTIANWEGGAQHPRPHKLAALASALGVAPRWLLDGQPGDDRAAVAYLAAPIRHVPVYRWPPKGQALDRSAPEGFVPLATDMAGLFALRRGTRTLVFESAEPHGPDGRQWLCRSRIDQSYHLADAHPDKGPGDGLKPVARLHTTITRHTEEAQISPSSGLDADA